ncbi:hypothetical protein B0T26DRAFT_762383 [Lasiosphaeria miniovina]|uniref:Uncharacterized protein n=1 Tax=Lasiosphaeria miniovina TaxID=1954250 RepID=A0AA40EEQ9_9PEZI|nr:uncharacterized protein B0T26DRAFT_762383 [Lasiosphaeria miniovina]KAK0734781.1 hypothetical protein B0T26DRAFT_762383 [Lasiosphaeria miniovina]
MKLFAQHALVLIAFGLGAVALPSAKQPETSDVQPILRRGHIATPEHLRIVEVVRYIEATRSTSLKWLEAGDRRLLTLPTDEWGQHSNALYSLVAARQAPPSAASGSGSTALNRCAPKRGTVVGGVESHPAQFWLGGKELAENDNKPGDPIHTAYRLIMNVANSLDRYVCERAMTKLITGFCQGTFVDFQGGYLDVFNAQEGVESDKLYSVQADPNSDITRA